MLSFIDTQIYSELFNEYISYLQCMKSATRVFKSLQVYLEYWYHRGPQAMNSFVFDITYQGRDNMIGDLRRNYKMHYLFKRFKRIDTCSWRVQWSINRY